MTDDDVRRTLELRAKALAAPIALGESAARGDEVLVFAIGRARVALAIRFLRGVRTVSDIAVIPGAPPALAGVALIAGVPVAVWRIGAVLGVDDPTAGWTRLVLIGEHAIDLVIGATAIEGVIRGDAAVLRASGIELVEGSALLADPRLQVVG